MMFGSFPGEALMYISPALVSHTAKDPACSHFPRAVAAKVVVVVVDIATLAAVSEIVLMKASDVCELCNK